MNTLSAYALVGASLFSVGSYGHDEQGKSNPHHGHVLSAKQPKTNAAFDLIHTKVSRVGDDLIFQQQVRADIGSVKPTPQGKLAGSDVFSYVWPTTLDSGSVGFEAEQGILALAMTAHPDFDDTPLVDENQDGKNDNDGNLWHSHWVVLVADDSCGPGALKVKDIAAGSTPALPKTWPGLPILIDSPNYAPALNNDTVEIRVPLADIGFPKTFNYDGVTAALRVNASVHSPLLCVNNVYDVASGDLSLPGVVQ